MDEKRIELAQLENSASILFYLNYLIFTLFNLLGFFRQGNLFDRRVKKVSRTNENPILDSSDIVFKVTVNLTSEKWDQSLATGKSNRKSDLLILKIQFGVSKMVRLGCMYVPENVITIMFRLYK